jgi:hypothetical protein
MCSSKIVVLALCIALPTVASASESADEQQLSRLIASAPGSAPPAFVDADRAAKQRAVGAAVLSLGAIMVPVSASWFLNGGIGGGCYYDFDGHCSAEGNSRANTSIGIFAGWHLTANVAAIAGNVIMVKAERGAGGPVHRQARAFAISGGVLVAASSVLMTLGFCQLHNNLAEGMSDDEARGIGAGMLAIGAAAAAAGVPLTSAAAYYSSKRDPLRVSLRPLTRSESGATALDGATVSLSGAF